MNPATLGKKSALAALPFAEHFSMVLATMEEFAERTADLKRLRETDGRSLSTINIDRVKTLCDQLAPMQVELQALLARPDVPTKSQSNALRAKYYQLRARIADLRSILMAKPLNGLLAEIKQLSTQVSDLFTAADERGEEMSGDEVAKVKDLNKKIEELEVKARDRMELEEIRHSRTKRAEREPARNSDSVPAPNRPKSLSDQVLENPEFKAWYERQQGISPSSKANTQSPPVQVKTLITGLGGTSGGAFVVNQQTGIMDMGTFMRPLRIADLVTHGSTTSDAVEFVRQTGFTNNAAFVAEATNTSTGTKPESAMTWERVIEAVKTMAHWIPITRRALSDVGQMRTYIDMFLRYGLDEVMDTQIIQGNGVGENLLGISNTPNIQSQAWSTDILQTTRKARTKVVLGGRTVPTAYGLHPLDWETIDLLQDNEARYFFGGPSALGTPRLWGLPVVESEAFTQGEGYCADWRQGVLWDREAAQIFITDSHSDFFIKNILVLLAELRVAFGVIRPAAFVEIDLTA